MPIRDEPPYARLERLLSGREGDTIRLLDRELRRAVSILGLNRTKVRLLIIPADLAHALRPLSEIRHEPYFRERCINLQICLAATITS